MSSLFDVDGSHVAQLGDSDLRSLVARLCEAELTCGGFPASAVTAGGDQDAADGGLDVRVALPSSADLEGFVPRASTGFQVKVPEMPANAILKEMRPSGRVRPVIEELVRENGAYIIASAKASTRRWCTDMLSL